MKKVLLVLVILGLSACTSASDVYKALGNSGYTEIAPGGYSFFDCGQDDTFATKFTARNPAGQIVEGTVCSGFFKGATVRF